MQRHLLQQMQQIQRMVYPAWEDSCNRIALACGFDRCGRKLDADAMEARAEKISYGQLMARKGKT